jgi:hypothetical protein
MKQLNGNHDAGLAPRRLRPDLFDFGNVGRATRGCAVVLKVVGDDPVDRFFSIG